MVYNCVPGDYFWKSYILDCAIAKNKIIGVGGINMHFVDAKGINKEMPGNH